jgi:uncharacterized membrane protein YkoI
MPALVAVLIGSIVLGSTMLGSTAGALAAERCLTPNEQKARAAAHAVVPLSKAMRAVRQRGEIVGARLCERSGRLVYLLTVLAGDGKVAQASVDAGNGAVITVH